MVRATTHFHRSYLTSTCQSIFELHSANLRHHRPVTRHLILLKISLINFAFDICCFRKVQTAIRLILSYGVGGLLSLLSLHSVPSALATHPIYVPKRGVIVFFSTSTECHT